MIFCIFLSACDDKDETPVRATLGDGQVLLGEVRTKTLQLAGGLGTVEIPLEDVGEVVPVEGGLLGDVDGYVGVWLRNGSELRGRWTDPELEMAIEVGGERVPVELPMNELQRFQLQGGEAWPESPVYRVRTSWGDDFLIDPERTQIVLENDLGTFAPYLSECRYVAPVGAPDGDWRIELATGTVLIGELQDDALTLALPMGPEEVTVPLDVFVSLKIEHWGVAPSPVPLAAPAEEPARARGADTGGWFDNRALQETKAQQAR
ncbi:MAG: hypothetical protein ACOZNI_29265 [Myxococcota bacterium]